MQLREKVAENEIDTPLRGLPNASKFEIIKIWEKEFIKMNEHTDNLVEASNRVRYLNNRCWKAFYMTRKKY